jgi:hypothetical protein
MSCSSRSPKPEHPGRRLAVQVTAIAAAGMGWPALVEASTPPAPAGAPREPLVHQGVTLWPRGEGRMRFLGLAVYTARLWAAEGFDPARHARHPLALELVYARAFSARQIAERSLQEMKQQTPIPQAAQAAWVEKLAATLPDVKPGDSLLGLHHPQQGALFRAGTPPDARVLGAVDDPLFSGLFFGIWLSPATSEPALRKALIGPG